MVPPYSLASKMTPRNLNLLALGIRWPFRKSRGSWPGLYERVNETEVDLGAENLNFHLRPHVATLSMYGWRTISVSMGIFTRA